ncbi:hypothetical protein [Rhodobacteraceae phage LS06-2018-MD06]|nr:hypothetical protein [Rhodobacteraceae phage LS06-2018-MD06]
MIRLAISMKTKILEIDYFRKRLGENNENNKY